MTASLSIGVLVYQRYITQSQPAGMIAALRASGHRVILLDPQSSCHETGNLSWLGNLDLIIARGRILGLLYQLGWIEMQEEPTAINDRRVSVASAYNETELTVRTNDKFISPQSYSGHIHALSCQVHDSCYTVIVNPDLRGDGNGLCIVNHPDQMTVLPHIKTSVHIRQYLPDDGCDLKLYGVEDRIWITGKPSSLSAPVTAVHP